VSGVGEIVARTGISQISLENDVDLEWLRGLAFVTQHTDDRHDSKTRNLDSVHAEQFPFCGPGG